jgi:hydroxymethylpyrimidine pyrophosphatase-like HAD family hydrolase
MKSLDTIKVIITDLDGTLLIQIIKFQTINYFSKKLDKLGYLIIVATGRHHLDAMPLIASPVSCLSC